MVKINNKKIDIIKFPNNESLIKNQFEEFRGEKYLELKFKYINDSSLIELMLVKGFLDKIKDFKVDVHIVYMPYSRMDRGDDNNLFTLEHIVKFIADLRFDRIFLYETHSAVTKELFNKYTNSYYVYERFYTHDLLKQLKKDLNLDKVTLVYPDAGAKARYSDKFKIDNHLTCKKVRDFETGKITSLEIEGDFIKDSGVAVIIDDLCSGGYTFKLTAEELKATGEFDKIYLIVGHCEKTIKERGLLESDLIECVLTTNSIIDKEEETHNLKIKEII